MGKKQRGRGKRLYFFLAGMLMSIGSLSGCTHFYQEVAMRPEFNEAQQLIKQGSHKESLLKYDKMIQQYPLVADKVLFEMGIIYASHLNPQKDYQKSLDYFHKITKNYPNSHYRQKSEVIISLIHEIINKEKLAVTQLKQIDKLEQQVMELEKKIEQMKIIDMNLNLKKKPIP